MVMTFEQLQEIVTRTAVTVDNIGVREDNLRVTVDNLGVRVDNFMVTTDRIIKELAEAQQETERLLQETQRGLQKMERSVEKLSGNVGGLGNDIGEVIEMIVLPGLKKEMNKYNHKFNMASPGKIFDKSDGSTLTEVDLFLENCEEVMVVEVKTNFTIGDMKWLLNRVKLLRKNEATTGLIGRTIYTAVAGLGIDENARIFAEEKGMYIVKIDDDYDNNKLVVFPPPEGKIGTW
jgi:hypothetical protein